MFKKYITKIIFIASILLAVKQNVDFEKIYNVLDNSLIEERNTTPSNINELKRGEIHDQSNE